MSESNDKLYGPEYRVYKPTNQGTGAASRFHSVSYKNDKDRTRFVIFVQSALQKKSDNNFAAFGWKDEGSNVTALLGDNDIADMLQVLEGFKEGTGTFKDGKWSGLYHNNPRGNTIINFSAHDKGYNLSIGAKRDGQTVRVGHGLTFGEGIILREMFRRFLQLKFVG